MIRLAELLQKLAFDPTRWTEEDSRELHREMGTGYSEGAKLGHLSEAVRSVVRHEASHAPR